MDVGSLNKLADKMLNKFGTTCKIYNISMGDYNPNTGDYDKSETSGAGLFAFLNASKYDYNGRYTIGDNERLVILKTDFDFNENSIFELSGIKYKVNKTEEIIYKDDTIVYKIIMKEDE